MIFHDGQFEPKAPASNSSAVSRRRRAAKTSPCPALFNVTRAASNPPFTNRNPLQKNPSSMWNERVICSGVPDRVLHAPSIFYQDRPSPPNDHERFEKQQLSSRELGAHHAPQSSPVFEEEAECLDQTPAELAICGDSLASRPGVLGVSHREIGHHMLTEQQDGHMCPLDSDGTLLLENRDRPRSEAHRGGRPTRNDRARTTAPTTDASDVRQRADPLFSSSSTGIPIAT